MKRVFVIYHSGEVYDRDSVRWYQTRWQEARVPENRERLRKETDRLFEMYHNIGDSVVYDSTLKLLDFDEVIPIDPTGLTDYDYDKINNECSYGIIRGSNYLHSEMDWGDLDRFLNKVRLPIVSPGIGMQAPHGKSAALSGRTAEIARALGGRCISLGVRGAITAEVLAGAGVKNVRIVGCPSMFRSLAPTWVVDAERITRLRSDSPENFKVAVTLRREIGPDYVSDVPAYLAAQKMLVREAYQQSNLQLYAQGELFEKFFVSDRKDLYEKLYDELVQSGWATSREDQIFEIYRKTLFFSDDIPVFLDRLSQADVTTGFRVHGVLPSLAQHVPGVLVDYDQRTRELIDTFSIPSVNLAMAHLSDILDVAVSHDYELTSQKYAKVWEEMKLFLDENDIPNRMV